MYDIIIIGGGPAGVSAALTVINRGKTVCIVSNPPETSNLWKASEITNYPGLPNSSGADILKAMLKQTEAAGAVFVSGTALSVMPMGKKFGVSAGSDFLECGAVVIASGVVQKNLYPGEAEYLGRGVSYCATCDGMLYKGKNVSVIGTFEGASEEADFLREIGCSVEYFDRKRAQKYEIKGGEKVMALIADGTEYKVDCVFVLRSSIAPGNLISGIEMENGHIGVDKAQSTSVPGIYACGDCTGLPYQIAPAVGEGNIAALNACKYLDKLAEQQ